MYNNFNSNKLSLDHVDNYNRAIKLIWRVRLLNIAFNDDSIVLKKHQDDNTKTQAIKNKEFICIQIRSSVDQPLPLRP